MQILRGGTFYIPLVKIFYNIFPYTLKIYHKIPLPYTIITFFIISSNTPLKIIICVFNICKYTSIYKQCSVTCILLNDNHSQFATDRFQSITQQHLFSHVWNAHPHIKTYFFHSMCIKFIQSIHYYFTQLFNSKYLIAPYTAFALLCHPSLLISNLECNFTSLS